MSFSNVTDVYSPSTNSTGLPQISVSPFWYWILSLFTAIVTVAGNGMVIYLVIARRCLHLTNNYFILSLAVADICTGIFVIPALYICEQLQTCNKTVVYVFINTTFFASVANVCIMTLDRYISIVIPLKYFVYMNTKRVLTLVCLSWGIPFIVAVIPATYAQAKPEILRKASRIYEPIQILVFVIMPIVLMLIVYLRIYIIARKISRQTDQTHNQLRYNEVNNSPERHKKERRERRNREGSVSVIGVVIVMFAFCWFLAVYNNICMMFNICPFSFESVIAAQLLLHVNSCINPIVYAVLKRDIRRELRRVLLGRRPQPDSFNKTNNSFAASTKLELR